MLVCPEKSRPDENKDKQLLGYTELVDAWAMGILAFELIVGRPPFEKESRAATYEHIMYRKAQFPAWLSDDARDFITTALAKVRWSSFSVATRNASLANTISISLPVLICPVAS